jgi:hypothetical protein
MWPFCNKQCQNRKDKKVELKYEYKNNKVEAKQETKQVAYLTGNNPTADVWNGISNVVGSVAGAATSIATGGVGSLQTATIPSGNGGVNGQIVNGKSNLPGSGDSSWWLWLLAAAGIYLATRK